MFDFLLSSPLALTLLGQDIEGSDLLIVGLLVILEGLLSIDNALVLGMLAKRLPKHMRAKALSYGLIGAFFFRVVAILTAGYLLKWTFIKFLGGGYLVFIALKHVFLEQHQDGEEKVVLDDDGNPSLVDAETGQTLDVSRENMEIEQRVPIAASLVLNESKEPTDEPISKEGDSCDVASRNNALFWKTVLVIELTDIAFAVDSILAALALAGSRSEKLWVVVTGGILGVVLMRFAARIFIRLLERYPRFELSAYLLVFTIGMKLLADWALNSDWSFHGQTWMGSWQPWFQSLEETRLGWVHGYEQWLANNWPLGISEAAPIPESQKSLHVEHVLNFHDLRRPECSGFWLIMLSCFFIGFLPRRANKETPAS